MVLFLLDDQQALVLDRYYNTTRAELYETSRNHKTYDQDSKSVTGYSRVVCYVDCCVEYLKDLRNFNTMFAILR